MAKGLDMKRVSLYLAKFPDPDLSTRFDKLNKLFLLLFAIAIIPYASFQIIEFLNELPPFNLGNFMVFVLYLGVMGFVLFLIHIKNAEGYLLAALWALVGIVGQFDMFFESSLHLLGFGGVLSIFVMVFAFVVRQKIFPYYHIFGPQKAVDGGYLFTEQ